MCTATTNGVQVSVEVFYQRDYSKPSEHEFMFAYRVTIANLNPFAVKVMARHWDIFDTGCSSLFRTVDGDGVLGKQPSIDPGDEYQYVSGCKLESEIGRMSGAYQMQNRATGSAFTVNIPAFSLIAPMKLN